MEPSCTKCGVELVVGRPRAIHVHQGEEHFFCMVCVINLEEETAPRVAGGIADDGKPAVFVFSQEHATSNVLDLHVERKLAKAKGTRQ